MLGKLEEACGICGSMTWCGRPCLHAPGVTPSVMALPVMELEAEVKRLRRLLRDRRPMTAAERMRWMRERRKQGVDHEPAAGLFPRSPRQRVPVLTEAMR